MIKDSNINLICTYISIYIGPSIYIYKYIYIYNQLCFDNLYIFSNDDILCFEQNNWRPKNQPNAQIIYTLICTQG